MAKRELQESWIYKGQIYGPGEVDVPEELAARIDGQPIPAPISDPLESIRQALEVTADSEIAQAIEGLKSEIADLKERLKKAMSKAEILAELEALGRPGDKDSTKDELWAALMGARAGQ